MVMSAEKSFPRSPRTVLKTIRLRGINQVSKLIEALRKHCFRGVFPFLACPPFCSVFVIVYVRTIKILILTGDWVTYGFHFLWGIVLSGTSSLRIRQREKSGLWILRDPLVKPVISVLDGDDHVSLGDLHHPEFCLDCRWGRGLVLFQEPFEHRKAFVGGLA